MSRDFDYSDEEDDDKQIAQNHNNNGGFGLKNTSPTLTNVSHEKLLNIAKSLTTDPATQNGIDFFIFLNYKERLRQNLIYNFVC